ncbi:DUF6249 domain-containing protein [Rivibacter subsaxonicus]|uniref:DUF6249 domain-containing protein n=1 Tax=Rivibacter subsaxonicus TaxID=457575 RepID=A0A4Q7W1N5_9BURK|nr:DUF6249 domain-containing protein [Rivibacter subsaxonicus]RZU02439.1 hypothetical protein EV670_0462 [Rivibacter subsaxonicus]
MDAFIASKDIVAITAILTGAVAILMPVLIVWIALQYRQRRNEKLYETVKYLADRGQPVPPELLNPPQKPHESPLFRAITLIGVGVGLAVMFKWLGLGWLMGIGALLVCIGVAQLIALRIERNRAPGAVEAGR